MATLHYAVIDGKRIAYSDETEFLLARALFYYRAINIGYGCKKRLVMPSSKKPVLAKAFSTCY